MIISTIAYQKFYDVLIDKFASSEISKVELDGLGKKSYLIWDVKNPKTRESRFHEVFHLYTTDTRHFYKKLGQFDPSKASHGYMNDGLMVAAFEYIGLMIPRGIKAPKLLPLKLKARILYQLFLENYYPEFWAENEMELKVYDHQTSKLVDKSQQTYKPEIAEASKPMADNLSLGSLDEEAVRVLIHKFYDFISKSMLEEAWDLLTPSFQKRAWKDNFERFSLGYTNTITMHDVHVFQIMKSGSDVTCKVYYEDDVVTYTSLELSNISKVTVSKLDNFTERVRTLQETASALGIKEFEKIELQKFFEPSVSEYLWYKCGIDPEVISDLLPSQETVTISRLYRFSCIAIEGQWLIKGIHPIKSYPLR